MWFLVPINMAQTLHYIRDRYDTGSQLLYLNTILTALDSVTSGPQHPVFDSTRAFVSGMVTKLNRERYKNYGENKLKDGLNTGGQLSWKDFDSLVKNRDRLAELSAERPLDYTLHLRLMVYETYVEMANQNTFRRDVFLTTRFGSPIDSGLSNNNLIFLEPDTGDVSFHFRTFKTVDTHGPIVLKATPKLATKIRESYDLFPRTYFISQLRDFDKPMSASSCSQFVRSCWVLDSPNDIGPTADEIRSSIVTRFWDTHPVFNDRDAFARRSGSSFLEMSRCYFKVVT